MLAIIRDKATGWVAGIIVGALIISFAFWGVNFYFGQGGNVNVATVNGEEIKFQNFQRSFYNLRQRMKSFFGDDMSLEEEELIKDQALQKLIDMELLNQIIADNNLRITNEKVVDTIKELEVFKGANGFDRSKYERSVSSLGMDSVFFESQLRMDLLSQQLQAGLSESLFVLDSELEDVLRLKLQTRDITYSVLELASFITESEVEETEIEAFYKANPKKYVDPEKVKIAYLELDVNELAKSIETDEETLRTYYIDNKDKYDIVEQRSIKRLFVKTAEEDADKNIVEASEEVKVEARATIEKALEMVNEGKDFEEVVEHFTEEGKGALQFSEHAFMAQGVMEKEVDEFLFASEEGEISQLIETQQGFNIVKVGEVRGGPKNVYENSAEQVEQDYKVSQAELQFFELADQLTTLSYEHSDTLEVAADAIGQTIIETEYFSREDKTRTITRYPRVISNSFDSELISSGQNSEAIELSDHHIVVLRVLDHKVATTKPLDEVREQVIADIQTERAADRLKEATEAIVEQLEAGTSADAVASDVEIEWSMREKIKRDDVTVNRSILRTAFQSGKPEEGKPIVLSNRMGSGDYSIVVVTATYDGEVSADDEKVKSSSDLELRRIRGDSEWQEFLRNARNNADVQIFEENI